jgi:hypothetical protein
MTNNDVILIMSLNARYAQALDGLLPDAAKTWANTFEPDGRVAVVDSSGTVVAEAEGRAKLAELWRGFPDQSMTRHWFNNQLIEVDGERATMRAYVMAISIKASLATIVRTGTYADLLVRTDGVWAFRERVLTLDPASHV